MFDQNENQQLTLETRETVQFLDMLSPNAPAFWFQSLPDEKDVVQVFTPLHKALAEAEPQLNDIQNSGQGIAVTINETDGEARKIENITRVRAIFVDDDNGFQGTYPLEPSCVVESSPGKFHRYWFVADEWPCDEEGKADFAGVMQRLIEDYGHDRNCKDLARVMRLPGSYHLKNEPHLVRIFKIYVDEQDKILHYTKDEILQAFPPILIEPTAGTATGSSSADQDFTINKSRILEALPEIPADSRDTWLPVGLALHHSSGGSEDAWAVFDDWSKQSDKYNLRENRAQWDSFQVNHNAPIMLGTLFQLAKDNGWVDGDLTNTSSKYKSNDLQTTWLPADGAMTQDAMEKTVQDFDGWGHKPSEDHKKGIAQICGAIEGMAEGSLEPRFYLSSLPPGMGKTTALKNSVRSLSELKQYRGKSIIVFLSRLDEIEKLVKAMGLSDREYSTLTSSEEINALGNPNKQEARVLFTTQQMLESKCKKHSSFEAMTDFHFKGSFDDKGRSRDVRVWDEAILPAMAITVNRYSIFRLLDQFSKAHPKLASTLEKFGDELKEKADQELITIPDIVGQYGLSEGDARELFKSAEDKDIVSKIWLLSGRTVRIRKDQWQKTALDYEDILPEDLAPLLILDASGKQRKLYKHWFEGRRNLSFLYSPQKNYKNLTIHLCVKGSGVRSYAGSGTEDLLDGIAVTIDDEIPQHEDLLVIHFKEDKAKKVPNIPDEIRRRLKLDTEALPVGDRRVEFLNYGRHTATNEYQSFKYVIMSGVYGYPTSAIEAMGRGAKKIDAETELSSEDFEEIKLGEIAHNMYQGANRGLIRLADGDDCPSGCHLYIIASKQSGVPNALSQIFPGAEVVEWKPIFKPSKKIVETGKYVLEQARSGQLTVKKKDIIEHVIAVGDDKNPSNFNRTVLGHKDLERYMKEEGWKMIDQRGKVTLEKI